MGLYDTFVVKGKEVFCPQCGNDLTVVTDGERWCDFQTKCLDGLLYTYENGKELPRFASGLKIVDGEIPIYTTCDRCGVGVLAYAVIKDGKFTDIRFPSPEEEDEIDELSFGTSYGKHYHEYDPKDKDFVIWSNLELLNVDVLYASRSKRDADAFLIGYTKRIREEHPTEIDTYSDHTNRFHFGGETYGIVYYKGFYFVVKYRSQWRYPCPRCGAKSYVDFAATNEVPYYSELKLICPLCGVKYTVTVSETDMDNENLLELIKGRDVK